MQATTTPPFCLLVIIPAGVSSAPPDLAAVPEISASAREDILSRLMPILGKLKKGTYSITYSVNDGIRVEGPHKATRQAIANCLAEPVANLARDFKGGHQLPRFSD